MLLPSLALRLRLALARPRWPDELVRSITALPRPEGPLLWLQISPESGADGVQGALSLLTRLRKLRPDLHIVVAANAPGATDWPARVHCVETPADSPANAALLLAHYRPSLVALMGGDLPAALIVAATQAHIPVLLLDAHVPVRSPRRGWAVRAVQRGLLARLTKISARSAESVAPLVHMGAAEARVEVGGQLMEPPEPLHCSETERASIAALTRTRPVWLAVSVPEAEIAGVLVAHEHAQRHAHRILLILAPDRPDDGEALAAQLESEGHIVARRSLEGEPDAETEIFLADDPSEYGIWYRIAPVCYFGGTLRGAAGQARSPMEAAALGSAIIHGPQTAPFEADYARLDEARAARTAYDERSLGEAVADLLAPDRAAILAHNAWAVTSSGAAAAETVARSLVAALDAVPKLEAR